jgi:hypothetical protein
MGRFMGGGVSSFKMETEDLETEEARKEKPNLFALQNLEQMVPRTGSDCKS